MRRLIIIVFVFLPGLSLWIGYWLGNQAPCSDVEQLEIKPMDLQQQESRDHHEQAPPMVTIPDK